MKQRGCRIRLFQLEWWKIHISDEDYQKQSWDEFRRLKMEAESKNWDVSRQGLAGEECDPFITAAENQCYRESPFFAMLNDLESQKFGYGDAPPPRYENDFSDYNGDAVNNNYDYDFDYGYDNNSEDSSHESKKGSANYNASHHQQDYDAEPDSQSGPQNNTQLTEMSTGSTGSECDDDLLCVNSNDNGYGYDNWQLDAPRVESAPSYEIDVSQSSFQQAVETTEEPTTIDESSCHSQKDSLGLQKESELSTDRVAPSLDDILGNVRSSPRRAPQTDKSQNNSLPAKATDVVVPPPPNTSANGTDVNQREPHEQVRPRNRTLSQEERIAEQIRLAEEIRRVDEKLEMLRRKKREREEAEAKQRQMVGLVSDDAGDVHESQLLATGSGVLDEHASILSDEHASPEDRDATIKRQQHTRDQVIEDGPMTDDCLRPEGIHFSDHDRDLETDQSQNQVEEQSDTSERHIDSPVDPLLGSQAGVNEVTDKRWSSMIYDFNTAAARRDNGKSESDGSRPDAELDYGYETTVARKSDELDYGYDTDNLSQKADEEDYGYDVESDPGRRHVSLVPMKECQTASNLSRIRRHTGSSSDFSTSDPPGDHLRSQSRHGRVQRATVVKNDAISDLVPNRRSSGQYEPNRRNTQGVSPLQPERSPACGGRKSIAKRFSSGVGNFLKRRVLMIEDEMSDSECDENKGASAYVASKVSRRRLSEEDQELLRCVGLDSFVTLRFLKFGFDVAFWPMIVSLFTLIPLYKTGEETCIGFFTTTVVNVEKGSWRFWFVLMFGYVQILYILRRLWIEWEVFLPLRYEFLENGDFEKEKYKEQYRKTCMIEYIPRAQKTDQSLYDFFDAIFPGQVQRAEVLLNTEYLTDLIKSRNHHIVKYEEIYAGKVHRRAAFLRQTASYQAGEKANGCCRSLKRLKPPVEPPEPTIYVRKNPDSSSKKVAALKWHYE
jgi:hypothetical protein